jgi:uracil-DNA glycosylase
MSDNQILMTQIRACTVCAESLPLGPKPIIRAKGPAARIVLISQAPGTRAHASGVPWNDASGRRLRDWMGLDATIFHDESQVAILPMGLCYPGKGKGGDAPPRPECAPLWHEKVLQHLPKRRLTILIGAYAQARYLGSSRKSNLGETLRAWRDYIGDGFLPLVHPSPRNQGWLKQNPWFEAELVPELKVQVIEALSA